MIRLMPSSISVINTRDSFGFGRNFMHTDDNGVTKEITTWKQWDKAGYKNALDVIKNPKVKELVKKKQKKMKAEGHRSVL